MELVKFVNQRNESALLQSTTSVIEHEFLSKKEAADYLRCSLATLNRLILKQKISFYKLGGRVLIKKGDLNKYIEAHKVKNV